MITFKYINYSVHALQKKQKLKKNGVKRAI